MTHSPDGSNQRAPPPEAFVALSGGADCFVARHDLQERLADIDA